MAYLERAEAVPDARLVAGGRAIFGHSLSRGAAAATRATRGLAVEIRQVAVGRVAQRRFRLTRWERRRAAGTRTAGTETRYTLDRHARTAYDRVLRSPRRRDVSCHARRSPTDR